jgi:hypothetical protein
MLTFKIVDEVPNFQIDSENLLRNIIFPCSANAPLLQIEKFHWFIIIFLKATPAWPACRQAGRQVWQKKSKYKHIKLRLQHFQFRLCFDYGYFGLFEGKFRFVSIQRSDDLSFLDILTFHDLHLFQVTFPLDKCFHLALRFELSDCIDQVIKAFPLGCGCADLLL